MRTFIAIPLPEECRVTLDQMQQSLRSYNADVRWATVTSIHLTLKFLGEADQEIIPKLAQSLKSVVTTQRSFDLRLHGLGCFPNLKNPRVIWCGVEGETEIVLQLQQQVESACAMHGFTPESRAFHPHLTLGRVKGKRNLKPVIDCIKMGSDLECSFTADCFNIYKSVLRPHGAVYTVLDTITLGT